MIRPARFEDIPRLVELGTMLHQQSSYADMPFDRVKVAGFLASLIGGAGVLFVEDRDGVVIGGLAGGITEQWFSSEKVAFDYSFFIEPSHRGGITAIALIKAFIAWARIKGAARITMGITTGINVEATSKFYRRLGFKDVGPLFSMEV